MDETLVERMRAYLAAGLAMDVDALDALYDSEFENVRVDEAGRSVVLTKADFMARFRSLREQGMRVGDSIDDVRFVATSRHGDQGTVIMYRTEGGGDLARYSYVWRRENGQWTTLLREFTFERDLSGLLRMMADAAARA
ncbi:nuclear transport factor 2 family protein [Kitasatospora sp. NPDC051984]|uniref:nuclear transport factor 2 family protein n=1 Tax=Kitasatospora sp. NPDC051984 TaxID=3364059 RepID=UPI0037C7A868